MHESDHTYCLGSKDPPIITIVLDDLANCLRQTDENRKMETRYAPIFCCLAISIVFPQHAHGTYNTKKEEHVNASGAGKLLKAAAEKRDLVEHYKQLHTERLKLENEERQKVENEERQKVENEETNKAETRNEEQNKNAACGLNPKNT